MVLALALALSLAVPASSAPHAAASYAAGAHAIDLTWTASPDAASVTQAGQPVSVTYNAYRAAGACAGGQVFAPVATGVTATTFSDTSVDIGAYCYNVTAVVKGAESGPSNSVSVTVLPQPPSGLSAVSR